MVQKAFLSRLKLTDFRNYPEAVLMLDGRHVVLTGDNGAGKTNLLEAVSFLSPGRGLRRAVLSEVSRVGGTGGFSVFAEVEGMEGEVSLGTGIDGDSDSLSRRLRINGTPARSTEELSDHLSVLWLTPAMDGLFTGPSADRRRFLDRLVLSIDPGHGRRASDFERAMRSRNRLLSEGRYDPAWVSAVEAQMAGLGISMAAARREMLGLLRHLASVSQQEPFPTPVLALEGFLDEAGDMPAAELEERYLDMLREGRGRDAAAGRTLEGPHRSDLLVRHREKDMDAGRCSTGEQKALLIGLILAHARLTANMTGFAPVLLLDEIAAHLDEGRRIALFDLVHELGGQAFMTGTDDAMFSPLGERAQFLEVDGGSIRRGPLLSTRLQDC
nr:DNA replication and repair protein RecF [Rhizobium sp. Q54]